jgi:spermidine synthase
MASDALDRSSPKSMVASDLKSGPWILLLAMTIFVSAFLLFQVQPLISKLILPWFGGSPTVWTTAMLFFQCVLFGGYAYAHFATKLLSWNTHLRVHLVLVVLSALMSVMITPKDFLKPDGDENPALQILLLLFVCVGLPYFTLASTGPLIQAWFAKVYPGKSPYRLYSLSNVGSFLALLSFPYVFEPLFELPQIGMAWTGLYWIFALLCCGTAIWLLKSLLPSRTRDVDATNHDANLRMQGVWLHRLAWIGLPALASLTMIAVTDHVSHNIAPEPRLWITTLGLYLLTFIITFDHERWYHRNWTALACLVAILFLTSHSELIDLFGLDWTLGISGRRWSHFVTMFLICYLCHGELVKLRPRINAYLTEFYLCISAGGACGGLFASIIAVNFFTDYYEWPLCLVIAGAISLSILLAARRTIEQSSQQLSATRTGSMIACLVLSTLWVGYFLDPFNWQPSTSEEFKTTELFAGRNFYGTISVDDKVHVTDSKQSHRIFYSGSVTHGLQLTDPKLRLTPLSYYGRESGAADAIEFAKSRQASLKIALVGLGTGSLAAYGREADFIDFYEINPEVIRVAQEYFSFIRECKSKTSIILGDGRLKMDQAPANHYDIILLDAFTGGSVPVHLLTKEAFAMYRRHLDPKGLIVVHITNRHLNLYPVVKQQAIALGLNYQSKFIPADLDNFIRRCHYFTMTSDDSFVAAYPSIYPPIFDENEHEIGRPEPDQEGIPIWTDHFSSINAIER